MHVRQPHEPIRVQTLYAWFESTKKEEVIKEYALQLSIIMMNFMDLISAN